MSTRDSFCAGFKTARKYLSPFSFCEKKRGTKEKHQAVFLSQSAPLVLLSRKLESYSEPPMVVFLQSGTSVSRAPPR